MKTLLASLRTQLTVDLFSTADRWFAGLFVVGTLCALPIVFQYDPSIPGTYPSCPSKWFSVAWDCPGCGTLRMLHRLLHLRFAEAFAFNPATFLCLPFLAYFVLHCAHACITGHGLPRLLMPVWMPRTILTMVFVFGIGRNLL
jgi:hypothetical protein